jgi:hypothetical protein
MKFTHMPELGWGFGYPFAVGLMGVVCVSLYVIFKRRDWLQRAGGRRHSAREGNVTGVPLLGLEPAGLASDA